jgi:DNA-binding response OmpR family regulator
MEIESIREFEKMLSSEQAASPQDVYDDGHLRIEHDSYYVSMQGTPVCLSRKEFLILSGLARRFGRIVPSDVSV